MKPDIKGLLKLGRFMQRLPRKNFKQNTWLEETKSNVKSECGTQGCVAGWAATLFPHRFKKVGGDSETQDDGSEFIIYGVQHRRTGLEGSDAFAAGFRIPEQDAWDITDADAHRNSPKVAAQNIFKLVKRLKKAASK